MSDRIPPIEGHARAARISRQPLDAAYITSTPASTKTGHANLRFEDVYLINSGFPVLQPKRTSLILAALMLALIALHVLAMQANFNPALGLKQAWGFEYWQIAIFDLDEEESFGTWFSAMILLYASILALYAAGLARAARGRLHRWWTALGLAFGAMSVDEVVGLHELLNSIYEDSQWTVAGFYLVVVVGLCFLPFLWHYRWRTSGLLFAAGFVYASGALGLEHFSGNQINSLEYNMLTGVEEGLEMAGVILAIYALLDFIHRQPGRE